MTRRANRAELEAGLRAAGESISRRVGRFERVVRPPVVEAGIAAGRMVFSSLAVRTGVVIGAGLLVGWILGGLGSRRKRDRAGEIADEVVGRQERGEDLREAVRRSVRASLPAKESTGFVASLVAHAARAGAQAIARALISEFSRRRSGGTRG